MEEVTKDTVLKLELTIEEIVTRMDNHPDGWQETGDGV